MLRRFGKALALRGLLAALIGLWPTLASAELPVLDRVTFGATPTRSLVHTIGPSARITVRTAMRVGGVAFTRAATGEDGWVVTALRYERGAPDGQRLSVDLSRSGAQVTVKPRLYDWELVPIARFVVGPGDSAFTYFGRYEDGTQQGASGMHPLGYHKAFANTLLGLRLMQLDLMLFKEGFDGYLRRSDGSALLGAGEAAALGVSLNSAADLNAQTERNYWHMRRANVALAEDCRTNMSSSCIDSRARAPHVSYVVGDVLHPIRFTVRDGNLEFTRSSVCWQLWRFADEGEVSGPRVEIESAEITNENGQKETARIAKLTALSQSFCQQVRREFNGIHPLAYRAGFRTARYSALFRHFKARDPKGYAAFARSMSGVVPRPLVETPTEVQD